MLVEPNPSPMPGLGPSLLSRFLADGQLGTQPGPRRTDGGSMVDPVRSAVRDPHVGLLASKPGHVVLSVGKELEFKRCLRDSREANGGAIGKESAGRPIECEADQIRRGREGSEDRPEPLAPELEAGGGGRVEPAELLALLGLQGTEPAAGAP